MGQAGCVIEKITCTTLKPTWANLFVANLGTHTQQSQKLVGNTKMYMNRTELFPIFSTKKALILTQETKVYLYSDVVRIHES